MAHIEIAGTRRTRTDGNRIATQRNTRVRPHRLVDGLVAAAAGGAFALAAVDVVDGTLGRATAVVSAVAVGALLVRLALRSRAYRRATDDLLHELTVREHVEAKLGATVALLRSTLESTRDGILVVDEDGTVVEHNRRLLELWGLDEIPNRVTFDDALAVIRDDVVDASRFVDSFRVLHGTDDEATGAVVFHDGRVYETYSAPHRIDGRTVGRVWCFRDMTARRDLEQRLVGAEAARAGLAVQPRAEPRPEDVDLNELVRSLDDVLRPVAGPRVELSVRLDPKLRPTRVDRSGVEQALVALVMNARDALAGGGAVAIETETLFSAAEPRVALRVRTDAPLDRAKLAPTLAFAHASGGRAEVEEAGVTIFLPAARAAAS